MDEPSSGKPKRVSYSFCGCFTFLALIVVICLAIHFYPSIRDNTQQAQLNNAMEEVKQTPPSTSLSNEDAIVLTVWMYFPVKMGGYVDDFNATEETSGERTQAIQRLENLLIIEHSLPTNSKYKSLTDAIKAMAHKRIELITEGGGTEAINDMALQSAVTDNMKKYAADIRYVTDVLPKDERNRILDRYYGSI